VIEKVRYNGETFEVHRCILTPIPSDGLAQHDIQNSRESSELTEQPELIDAIELLKAMNELCSDVRSFTLLYKLTLDCQSKGRSLDIVTWLNNEHADLIELEEPAVLNVEVRTVEKNEDIVVQSESALDSSLEFSEENDIQSEPALVSFLEFSKENNLEIQERFHAGLISLPGMFRKRACIRVRKLRQMEAAPAVTGTTELNLRNRCVVYWRARKQERKRLTESEMRVVAYFLNKREVEHEDEVRLDEAVWDTISSNSDRTTPSKAFKSSKTAVFYALFERREAGTYAIRENVSVINN